MPALLKRGHELAVLYEYPSPEGRPTVDPPRAVPVSFWDDLEPKAALNRIRAFQPDVVYSHSSHSLDLEKALLDHYPTLLYSHVFVGTCATGRKCHTFPHAQPCTRKFGPMCLALHYPRRCGGLNPLRAWRGFHDQSVRNSRLKDYRAILVASSHMYEEYKRHGISADKLDLLALPITDTNLETLPYTPRVATGSILFLGRLTDLKGVDYLVRAIPAAANLLGRPLRLTVAGDGQELPRLEALARRLGIAVDFTGWIESERKREVIQQADLLAVPSLWPEPFGLVGIEAQCFGLPAVGYAVGGIPDWLLQGRTGELAPGDPPTVEGLANAIVRALADSKHYSELCRGAWEMSRRFTLERHVAKLEPALQTACAGTPALAVGKDQVQ